MTMSLSAEALRGRHGHLDGGELLAALLGDGGPLGRGGTALVSSFGTESVVLLHMAASVDRAIPVIFLDTGKHFPATLAYRDRLVRLLGLTDVRAARPDATVLARHDPASDLSGRDPDTCCEIRKTDPLAEALHGFQAWITGRKRFQGGLRQRLDTIEEEPGTGRVKLNPLATWTQERVEAYRRLHDLPAHPLLVQGYPSVGCEPCTLPVKAGEAARAGRWFGLDKTECGIHLPALAAANAATTPVTAVAGDAR
jgi:phosphoadenosine phosphosulfate reductase